MNKALLELLKKLAGFGETVKTLRASAPADIAPVLDAILPEVNGAVEAGRLVASNAEASGTEVLGATTAVMLSLSGANDRLVGMVSAVSAGLAQRDAEIVRLKAAAGDPTVLKGAVEAEVARLGLVTPAVAEAARQQAVDAALEKERQDQAVRKARLSQVSALGLPGEVVVPEGLVGGTDAEFEARLGEVKANKADLEAQKVRLSAPIGALLFAGRADFQKQMEVLAAVSGGRLGGAGAGAGSGSGGQGDPAAGGVGGGAGGKPGRKVAA